MSVLSVLSLVVALFVLAATPGPGVFATISRSMASGFVPSLGVVAGIVTGDIIFLLFAVFGLSIIAQTMGGLFVVVKLAGGAYLIFLGVRIFRSEPETLKTAQVKKRLRYGNYFSGLFITLSNPKVILFYCGFLPTFLDLSALTRTDILIVALTVALVLSGVLTLYAWLADRARTLFVSGRAARRLNRAAGGVMIATGVAIAAQS